MNLCRTHLSVRVTPKCSATEQHHWPASCRSPVWNEQQCMMGVRGGGGGTNNMNYHREIFYSALVIFLIYSVFCFFSVSLFLLWWSGGCLWQADLWGFTVASTVVSVFVYCFKLFDWANKVLKISIKTQSDWSGSSCLTLKWTPYSNVTYRCHSDVVKQTFGGKTSGPPRLP